MIILFPFDNTILYKENKSIKEIELSTSAMEEGKIKNIPIFEEELRKESKKRKWITLFQSKMLQLILPMDYNEKEKEVFIVILENIGFHNIKCKKEKIPIKKNQVFLELHKNYLNKVYLNKNQVIQEKYPYYILGNIEKTISYIISNYPFKKRFYFIGSYPHIPSLVKSLNQRNVFYYLDAKTFILKHTSP